MVGGSKIYPRKVAGECGGGDNGETSGLQAKISHALRIQHHKACLAFRYITIVTLFNDTIIATHVSFFG